eukprot:UN15711
MNRSRFEDYLHVKRRMDRQKRQEEEENRNARAQYARRKNEHKELYIEKESEYNNPNNTKILSEII